MRRYVFVALAVAAAVGPALARTARAQAPAAAQVSDADKKAARDLYFQGVELQQAGKFDAALDRFQRAQAVFAAPTHLLRIAECQAALGKLVEAAEAYRALTRAVLPPGAPQAFQAAQQQGAAELPQVEPRIPALKIEVTPASVKDLQVTLDDQPMSAALVGVARSVNPGPHKVTVTAPGYSKAEQTVSLKERETKAISLALEKSASSPAPPPYVILPSPGPAASSSPTSEPPAAPPPATYEPPKPTGASRSGFLIGARIGGLAPGGAVFSGSNVGDRSGLGTAIAIEGGYRFAKIVILGLSLEGGAFLGPGDPGNIPAAENHTYDSKSGLGAVTAQVISSPSGVGVLGELGFGYRVYSFTRSVERIAGKIDLNETFHGPEVILGGGLYLKASDGVRIIPKVDVGLGQFSNVSRGCDATGTAEIRSVCTTVAGQLGSASIANGALHSFVFFGLGVYYGHDSQ